MFKKVMLCLIGIACIAMGYPAFIWADGPWLINRAHTVISITEEGEVEVSETIRVDLRDSNKTGISRQIPLKYEVDGKIWFVKVNDITVQRNQVDEVFLTRGDTNQMTIDVGDTRLELAGEQSYTIHYTVTGALRHNGTSDFFYWNATGGWETTVEQATAVVRLPKEGVSGEQCEILPARDQSEQEHCQSVGLSQTETRFAVQENMRPRDELYVQTTFTKGLIPIATVRPPSLMDWLEVYRQPLLILAGISGICLLAAGWLRFKTRRSQSSSSTTSGS